MQPHEGGERCRGTATPDKDAGAKSIRGGRPPLHPPRGVAQRLAAWAAGLDPTYTTIGPNLFSIGPILTLPPCRSPTLSEQSVAHWALRQSSSYKFVLQLRQKMAEGATGEGDEVWAERLAEVRTRRESLQSELDWLTVILEGVERR